MIQLLRLRDLSPFQERVGINSGTHFFFLKPIVTIITSFLEPQSHQSRACKL